MLAAPLSLLHAACFPDDPWEPRAMAGILAIAGCFGQLAWEEDEPTGLALAFDLGGECEIVVLGVDPRRRRVGTGSALLDAICDETARRGGHSVFLEVAADNERGARALCRARFCPDRPSGQLLSSRKTGASMPWCSAARSPAREPRLEFAVALPRAVVGVGGYNQMFHTSLPDCKKSVERADCRRSDGYLYLEEQPHRGTIEMNNSDQASDLLALTTEIVAAHVSNNTVSVGDLPQLINQVYNSLANIGSVPAAPAERPQPAVPVKKSVFPDYIVCLEDGKKLKMLKRHLKTAYNMTPEAYRERWGLAPDYPMVAPNYARQRSRLAKEIGLGTRARRSRA